MPTPATLDIAIGRNAVVFVTPQIKVAGDGGTVFEASGGPYSFVARFSDADIDFPTTTENLSPVGSFNANPVPYEQEGRFQISEYVYATQNITPGTSGTYNLPYGNVLRVISQVSSYMKFEIQEFDNESPGIQVDDFVMYCVVTTPIHRTITKPRQMDSAVFELIPLIDASTGLFLPNPVWTSG